MITNIFFHRRVVLIAVLFIISILITFGTTAYITYCNRVKTLKTNLIEFVEQQSTIITVMHQNGKNEKEIVSLLNEIVNNEYSIRNNGKIAIAKQDDNQIKYLFIQNEPEGRGTIFYHGEYMRMAIKGIVGSAFSDLSGTKTLIAYKNIPNINWGIVASIPCIELGFAFYSVYLFAFLIILITTTLCVLFFIRITKPILKEISDSEIHYRSLFENNYVCMLVFDPDTLNIIQANPAASRFYGYKRSVLVKKNITDINTLPIEELKLQLGKAQSGCKNQFRFKHKLCDGTIRDVESSVGMIQIGNEYKFYSIVFDITERKQAEEMLMEREEQFRTLFEQSYDAIFLVDISTGKYLDSNKAAEKLLGITKEHIKNLKTCEISPKGAVERLTKLQQFNGASHFGEVEYVRPDGTIRFALLNSIPISKSRIFGIAHDITERKKYESLLQEKNREIVAQNKAYLLINEELSRVNSELKSAKERAEESNRLKTAFIQNISHEIRTPMNAIVGFSTLMAENYNNRQNLEKFSKIINQRCQDLLEIINSILDIAKIESGLLPVNIQQCHIKSLFHELFSFFKEYQIQINKKHILFNLNIAAEMDNCVIPTDKIKLKQIMMNLISNSFKFTQLGSIEAGCRIDNNGKFIFYVSDTGTGIPFEKQSIVFERFVQLEETCSKIGGTGLGLSIVKGLVKLLGGEIFLESVPGEGTTFSFTLAH